MSPKPETEVLVVGAGPVGLFTGLCLARAGVRVQIVDEEFRTAAHSYALALHPRSLQLLHDLDLTAELLPRSHAVDTVAFYDGANRCGELKLAKLGGNFPQVAVLPQSVLEGMLEQRLKSLGVKVLWNHRVAALRMEESGISASIDKLARGSCGYAVATTEWVVERTLQTDAAFAVGADGHRSVVRNTVGGEYATAGPTETFAVFEFHSAAELGGEVRVVFHESTSNVLWPLPGGRCRWSFQLEDAEPPADFRLKRRLTVPIGRQSFPHLTGDDFDELTSVRAPWFAAAVHRIDWSMKVRFDRRLAERFGHHRCWLAGDSAHLTGPVGAQSLNMGLREAFDLSGKLVAILRQGEPLDSLRRYNDEHVTEWRRLLSAGGGLAASGLAEPWARRCRGRILACIPATGDDLSNLLVQVGLSIEPEA